MFDSLKKKFKEAVTKLSRKAEEEPPEEPKEPVAEEEIPREMEKEAEPEAVLEVPEVAEEEIPEEIAKEAEPTIEEEAEAEREVIKEAEEEPDIEEVEEKGRFGIFRRIKERVTKRQLTPQDIDSFFEENETDLLQANVALEVIDFMKASLKKKVAGKDIKRGEAERFLQKAFEEALLEIVDQGEIDIEREIKKKKPLKILFLGFNGSGKTTSLAKLAKQLKDSGFSPVLAAGDTFRAASIEQLEVHGKKTGIHVIKHKYGADSAAVIFDAAKHAEAKKLDAVLADTAGRTHVDKNLMDELSKVVRVNKPDLKILVIDSLTGNDAVEQARKFDEAVGIDGTILTKIDVNKKGGAVLSVAYATKKPILYFGTGQGYGDLQKFEPEKFVKELIEG